MVLVLETFGDPTTSCTLPERGLNEEPAAGPDRLGG